jgi:hypothetical protein
MNHLLVERIFIVACIFSMHVTRSTEITLSHHETEQILQQDQDFVYFGTIITDLINIYESAYETINAESLAALRLLIAQGYTTAPSSLVIKVVEEAIHILDINKDVFPPEQYTRLETSLHDYWNHLTAGSMSIDIEEDQNLESRKPKSKTFCNLKVTRNLTVCGDLKIAGILTIISPTVNNSFTLIGNPQQACIIFKDSSLVEKARICSSPIPNDKGVFVSVDGGVTQNLRVDTNGNTVIQPASALSGQLVLGGPLTNSTNISMYDVGSRNLFIANGPVNVGVVGADNIAIGTQANSTLTTANSTIALGNGAVASADNTLSIGSSAQSSGGADIAIGQSAHASNLFSIAIGDSSTSSGFASLAAGNATTATQDNAVCLGNGSTCNGNSSIAIGHTAQAIHNNDIGIGTDAQSNGGNDIAIGQNANASNLFGIAIGSTSTSSGFASLAVGNATTATQDNAVCLGNSSTCNGNSSIAIGHTAQATQGNAISIGTNAAALATNSIAIGENTIAPQADSLILGDIYNASFAVGIGTNTPTTKLEVVAPGTGSTVTCLFSVPGATSLDTPLQLANLQSALATPLVADGTGKVYLAAPSSKRYKKNIRSIEQESNLLYEIKPVLFDYNYNEEKNVPGFIAEELYEKAPELNMVLFKDGQVNSLNYQGFHALTIREIQKHKNALDQQHATIAQLLAVIEHLKSRIEHLEQIAA